MRIPRERRGLSNAGIHFLELSPGLSPGSPGNSFEFLFIMVAGFFLKHRSLK